jgi:hypothetical protein
MSDPADGPGSSPGEERADEAPPPPTPFDHPLFLPVLLLAFCAWFGYDAYWNQDPEMLEHLAFNRFGFRVLVYFAAYFGVQGWAEMRGREPHPLLASGLLAAMALWFAASGWWSGDPLDQEYAGFHRHTALALVALAAVEAWDGARRMRGQRRLGPALPVALVAVSVSYGWRAGAQSPALAFAIACAGFGALALWLAFRRFQDWRRRAAREAPGAL